MSKEIVFILFYLLILIISIVICIKEYGIGITFNCIVIGLACGLFVKFLLEVLSE